MNITVLVDQARALREGINAPSHRVTIGVDPAELTETEREVLAGLLKDGHDTTRSTFEGAWNKARQLTIVTQDLAGLRRGIRELLDWQAELAAEAAQAQAEADRKIDEAIAAGPDIRKQLVTLRENEIVDAYVESELTVLLTLPCPPKTSDWQASDGAKQRLRAAQAVVRAEEQQIREAARPELERLRDVKLRREAKADAAYTALYERLPEALRQRHEAGFASAHEVSTAMRRLALADVGQELDSWCLAPEHRSEELLELSEAEFSTLQAARDEAPPSATVEPHRIWIASYRPATEEELDDGLGDDDDEIEERFDERRVLLVRWHVGRLGVTAVVPFSS